MKIDLVLGEKFDIKGNSLDNKIIISEMDNSELEGVRILLQSILKYGQIRNANEVLEGLSLDSIIKQVSERQKSA